MTRTTQIFKELLQKALQHQNEKGFDYFRDKHQVLFNYLYNFKSETMGIYEASQRSILSLGTAEKVPKQMMKEMREAEEQNDVNKLPYIRLVRFIRGAVDAEEGDSWGAKVVAFLNNNMWEFDFDRYVSLVGHLSIPKGTTYNDVYQFYNKWKAKQNKEIRQKESENLQFYLNRK